MIHKNMKIKFREAAMKTKKIMIVAILLFFTSYVWAENAGVLSDLVNPKTITIEGNQMYITELDTIFLYSLKDLKLQKKFGGKGDGPGEFRTNPFRSISLSVLPDSILVNSIGRITFFSRDGKYLKQMKAPIYGGVIPLGKKFIGYSPINENGVDYVEISIYKAGQNNFMEREQAFYKFKYLIRGNVKIDPVSIARIPKVYTYRDKIVVDDGMKGEISVFDSSGKLVNSIKPECDKIALAGKLKDEYVSDFKINPEYKLFYERFKQRIKFSDYLPLTRNSHVVDNKIYVLTYKRDIPGKGELLIYDFKGTLLKRTMIPFKECDMIEFYPYTINDNKIYQLIESEDNEKWELHISDIK
jgi:hypothetical protein